MNIKVARKYGDNDQYLEDIILHSISDDEINRLVIKADKGEVRSENDSYLQLILRNGNRYEEGDRIDRYIIEDIYDTGETLRELIDYLNKIYEPKDLKTVVMLDKKIEKKSVVKIDWKGFDIEDTWVYGYGMDDETGNNRQVPFISDE